MNLNRKKILVAVMAATGWASSAANAQMVLEEVIVVANRVESNLMETATAVTAFDSGMRDQLGIENAQDISARTPSLTIAPSRISIRGIGRPTVALGSDPGVGLYWDGVYNTENDVFSYSNFLDIDRIEVLRGPQGTLFGRNASAGLISIITAKPRFETVVSGALTFGNYDYRRAELSATGGLSDTVAARIDAGNSGHLGRAPFCAVRSVFLPYVTRSVLV